MVLADILVTLGTAASLVTLGCAWAMRRSLGVPR